MCFTIRGILDLMKYNSAYQVPDAVHFYLTTTGKSKCYCFLHFTGKKKRERERFDLGQSCCRACAHTPDTAPPMIPAPHVTWRAPCVPGPVLSTSYTY